jgi:septal ring factor EnvC (AmiA/AmiB activator)
VEPNPRLNLAFVATLFNAYPALGPTKEELADAKVRELQLKLNAVMKELEEVKLQKKALEGELAQQKAAYEALSDQLRTIALKLSDSYSDKNELLKAKAAIEKEMQAAETRSLSLMEQLRVASEERTQLERAAGDSSVLVKNLTAQYEAKIKELTAEVRAHNCN